MTDKPMSPRDRLWIVSELYYPEQTSTGYFLTHIAEGLASAYDTKVICGQPSYSERGELAPSKERRNNVEIFRMKSTHFNKDRLLLRIINSITLTLAVTFFALWNFQRNDRILVVTNPPILPPILGIITKFKRQRSFLLVHDVYPEVLAATGILNRENIIYRCMVHLFNLTYNMFGHIIVLGRDMEELFRTKLGQNAKITIIPNWADLDAIQPIEPHLNPFITANALSHKTIIQYSGNIGRTHDIELILEVAKRLEQRDDIMFMFVGYGGKSDLLRKTQMSDDCTNVMFLPRQSRDMLGPMLASATATVVAFVPEMVGLSVPSRMYNILAAGVPIIAVAQPQSELCRVVNENSAGWTVLPRDSDRLLEVVLEIANRTYDANQVKANARKAVDPLYSAKNITEKYVRLMNE